MSTAALYTLAEIPGGAVLMGAFNMQKYFPTLASQHIRYLKPATTPCTVELRLTEEQMEKMEQDATETGKAKFDLEVELKD